VHLFVYPPIVAMQRRNIRGVVFYAVSFISNVSRRLVLPRTSSLKNDNINLLQQEISASKGTLI
jgi:hypothetical protein